MISKKIIELKLNVMEILQVTSAEASPKYSTDGW